MGIRAVYELQEQLGLRDLDANLLVNSMFKAQHRLEQSYLRSFHFLYFFLFFCLFIFFIFCFLFLAWMPLCTHTTRVSLYIYIYAHTYTHTRVHLRLERFATAGAPGQRDDVGFRQPVGSTAWVPFPRACGHRRRRRKRGGAGALDEQHRLPGHGPSALGAPRPAQLQRKHNA